MRKIKVLIVDDHQIVRDGIERILTAEDDIELVASLSNGTEALNFIKLNPVDVVIADMSMPDISGIELTKKITASYPEIKVFILSMFNSEEYIVSSIQAGAKGYLPKQDTTTDVLLDAIRTIAAGEEYFPRSVSRMIVKNFTNNARNTIVNDHGKKQQLTQREKEILKLYIDGFSNNEIAVKLNLSIFTVKTHKNNIMQKYNFKSTVEMIKFALKNNIVEL